jgi:hypothetical protein
MTAYKTMTPSEIQKASLQQKVVLFGTVIDKIDKLENRGVHTENEAITHKVIHDLGPGFVRAISDAKNQRNQKRITAARKQVILNNDTGGRGTPVGDVIDDADYEVVGVQNRGDEVSVEREGREEP